MNSRDGWRRVTFGDVVRKVKETADPESSGLERYVAGEHMDTNELQITRWGAIGDGYLGPALHRRFRSGQVLYGSRRTYLRKVALADFDGHLREHDVRLRDQGSEHSPARVAAVRDAGRVLPRSLDRPIERLGQSVHQ